MCLGIESKAWPFYCTTLPFGLCPMTSPRPLGICQVQLLNVLAQSMEGASRLMLFMNHDGPIGSCQSSGSARSIIMPDARPQMLLMDLNLKYQVPVPLCQKLSRFRWA